MAGLLDGLVKGLASFAPQDDPDVKLFNVQNEFKELRYIPSIHPQKGRRARFRFQM